MNNYYLLALLAAFFIGVLNSMSQLTLYKTNKFLTLFLRSILTFGFAIITYRIFGNWDFAITSEQFVTTVLYAICGFFGLVSLYRAFEIGRLGIILPLVNTSAIAVVIFGAIFFGFSLTFSKVLAIAVVIFGVIFLTTDLNLLKSGKLFSNQKGVGSALLTWFFWGIAFNGYATISRQIDPFLVILIIELVNLIFSFIFLLANRVKLEKPPTKTILAILASSFLLILGWGLQIYASSKATPGIVSAIVATDSIVALGIARVFLKEKIHRQQIIAITIILFGLVVLNLV